MAEIPHRVIWAVKQLDVEPDDDILEIGCGDGSALTLISTRLRTGSIIGVDRSALAIRAAQKRNRAGLKKGNVRLIESELSELRLSEQFGKVFTINVNVFWHRPRKELAVVRSLLRSGGELVLMYEPPAADQLDKIAELTRRNLQANGLDVTNETRANLPASSILMTRARLSST